MIKRLSRIALSSPKNGSPLLDITSLAGGFNTEAFMDLFIHPSATVVPYQGRTRSNVGTLNYSKRCFFVCLVVRGLELWNIRWYNYPESSINKSNVT
jgi:hypothetical protein